MFASWSRRRSSGGWVANSVEKLKPLRVSAGTRKKALNASAWRRSRVGIRAISPLIFVSADASADGRPVSSADERSAASSRYRDNARVSRNDSAYTTMDTTTTVNTTTAAFWSRPRPAPA
jgi:hypothetical protein